MSTPARWPWPGDTRIGQVQRIAGWYRDLAESLARGIVIDPTTALADLDRQCHEHGHHWITPTSAPQPRPDTWLTVADAAHYVSQYTPCTERNIRDWIRRHLIDHRRDNGHLEVRWGSILDLDKARRT